MTKDDCGQYHKQQRDKKKSFSLDEQSEIVNKGMPLFTIQQRYKYYFSCCIFLPVHVRFFFPSADLSLCAFYLMRFFSVRFFPVTINITYQQFVTYQHSSKAVNNPFINPPCFLMIWHGSITAHLIDCCNFDLLEEIFTFTEHFQVVAPALHFLQTPITKNVMCYLRYYLLFTSIEKFNEFSQKEMVQHLVILSFKVI